MGWDALMVLSAFFCAPVTSASQCGLAEFICGNGKCISAARFCDGTDDCGDASDEVVGCTNCNRSLYGQVNQKQPLRITETFQRYPPFVCTIHFIAPGGELGDMVELNFLSFQTGALEIGRNQTLICEKGYMQIMESSSGGDVLRSQQTRGLTQLMSAMGHSAADQVVDRRPMPHFGQFCGEMVGRSVAYYSEGGNISLVVSIPSRASILTYSFSLYLTYKFIKRLPPPLLPANDEIHFGVRLTDTYCDRIFVNCDRKTCKIRSPNFPGFYLRNITCYYHVKQETLPRGRRAQIVFQQVNEYKISIFTGRTTSGTMNHRVLTSDCLGDVVRIYDGNTTKAPLLTQFCGSGPLPAVVASVDDVLVELYSAPYQFLHNSRVELDMSVRYVKENELRMTNGKCEFVVDGRRQWHGIIYSPRHTVPPNTSCVYYLRGRTPHDRVWVTFLSYFVEDKHQWSGVEKCDASRLEIYDTGEVTLRSRSNASDDAAFAFCEKLSPKICARAATDHAVPIRPCEVTTESYLSSGSEMVLRQLFFRTQELPSRQSNFEARFEFVDTRQDGKPLTDREMSCDRVFNSSTQTDGSFSSPKNVFLFGRGGRENLTCFYRFEGQPSERVVIRITSYRLRSFHCRHFFDDITRRHRCHITMRTGQMAILQATEHWGGNFASAAGCLCNQTDEDHGKVATFESVSPKLILTFTVIGMTPLEDFREFRFSATYEFANHSLCDTSVQRRNGSEGELTFQQFVSRPLRCRWLLQATQGKYLYLKFRGTSSSYGECSSGNRFVVYAGENLQPISSVCVQEGIGAQKFDIFSSSWYNETARGAAQDDLLFVETLGSGPGVFSVKWLEVTRPFLRTQSGKMLRNVNCLYECPELNACISPDLWCDGVTHCPSGYDEARDHCDRFPTLYVAVGAGVGLLLLIAVLVILLRRCRRRTKCKVSRPSTTEDFQLECARF